MPSEPRRSTFVSPVLVGRDDLLELADRSLADARAGDGRLLLLAGEAGIGKTRLLGAIGRRTGLAGIPQAAAAAFPGDLELAGGLLIDLARDLVRHEKPAVATDAGRRLEARLVGDDVTTDRGDLHRRRRLLVLDSVDLLASLATGGPVVVLLEDLHWADDLSLEVLAQLARRLPELEMLVVGTYRSDEVSGRIPMRDWRTRLLAGRLAEEARLERFGASEIATMAGALLGQGLPVPADVVEALELRCDGIPLHVEEFLGALGTADPTGGRLRSQSVPATLADAVLRRAESLQPESRDVAAAASIVGREFDVPLLVEVTELDPAAADRALVELIDRHFVVRADEPGRYDFRHALIRDALHDAVPDIRRHELHRRIAIAATGRPEIGSEAFLSMHYAGALMGPEAYRLARSAGRRAADLSSHREAVELFDRVLRFTPADAPAAERAGNLVDFAAACAAIDDNVAADDAYRAARALLEEAGDPIGTAALAGPHVAVRHLLGDDLEARVSMLMGALSALDAAEASAVDGTRAGLEAGLSAAYMLDRRLDEAIQHGERALSMARALGDRTAEINASTTLGAVFVMAGRMDDGWTLLEDAVSQAIEGRLEVEAARGYRMLGTGSSVLVEYDRSEHWLREGMEYAHRVELWNHHHYMASHLAHVAWATGDWPLAWRLAEQALADGRGGITTRITCLHVLGFVALGRGEWAAAHASLDEARQLGEQMAELQRLSPALWGLAEMAELRGEHAEAARWCEQAMLASERVRDAAYAFPFLVTGTRAQLGLGDPHAAEQWVERVAARLADRNIPGTLPAIDHGRGLVLMAKGSNGRARTALEAAAGAWRERRRAWEGTTVLLDLARCAVRSNRRVEAGRHAAAARDAAAGMGAAPLEREAEDVLRTLRRHDAAVEPWAPLTAREFAVARLVAEGLTNGAIAGRLEIAPKTVAAHIEHILAKLGVGRRAEIAAWTATRPVLHSGTHGDDREE